MFLSTFRSSRCSIIQLARSSRPVIVEGTPPPRAVRESRFDSGGYVREYSDSPWIQNDDDAEHAAAAEGTQQAMAHDEHQREDDDARKRGIVGGFQQLPMVSPSHEIIESALKRADRVGYNKKLKNEGARAKNRAARQLDTLMKELTKPLGKYENGFMHPDSLHPFEKALLSLSVGEDRYLHAVEGVVSLRKSVVGVAKGYAGRCSKSPTKKEALDLRDEGFSQVESTYKRYSYVVEELKEIAKSLRKLPVVDPDVTTVALVGAPNVGKSSLVQLLSSGLPEVQNYPFTTRSIKVGHFFVNTERYQVTDTPGLLYRADEDRNQMEMLTLASLQYLKTSVLFVMDLTGECGTSLYDQWRIREELLERFPEKQWIDVFSKADILEEELDRADELLAADTPIKADIDSLASSGSLTAVDMACLIPDAARVSSITGDGTDSLKERMIAMFDTAT